MQFTAAAHAGVADGSITRSVRLWKRPHVKVGGRYNVGNTSIEVDAIEVVPFSSITERDARASGLTNREAMRAFLSRSGTVNDETLVHRVSFHRLGGRIERVVPTATAASIAATIVALDAIDARSASGPWTHIVLAMIDAQPATVSTELARQLGVDRMKFKHDVRKLKALGLTDSLEVGYVLTPFGQAVVRHGQA